MSKKNPVYNSSMRHIDCGCRVCEEWNSDSFSLSLCSPIKKLALCLKDSSMVDFRINTNLTGRTFASEGCII